MLTSRNTIERNGHVKPTPPVVPTAAAVGRNAIERDGHVKPTAPAVPAATAASRNAIERNGHVKPTAPVVPTAPAAPKPVVGFHGAVGDFKRRLIEATLSQAGGNRTRAAKALGLQRTYLLRLMREFEIRFPAASPPGRRSDSGRSNSPPAG